MVDVGQQVCAGAGEVGGGCGAGMGEGKSARRDMFRWRVLDKLRPLLSASAGSPLSSFYSFFPSCLPSTSLPTYSPPPSSLPH